MMDFVNDDSKIFLGNNLRWLRKRKKLSQEELATNIGLNRGNIASYEKGTAEPKICNLVKIATFFKVSMLELTKQDLQKEPLVLQNKTPENLPPAVIPIMKEYNKRAEELQEVLDSLHCYHCYKMKSLEELPKDMQMIVTNFEKLFEVTQVLMDSHKGLIDLVKTKCKERQNVHGQ